MTDENEEQDQKQKLPLRHILTSVLAAAIGVQSKKNQEKDFNGKGSIYIYIAAGVIFTALFVITVATVVKTVLANAGM
jgi:glycopeptide antibiotics resistance protein